MTGFARTAGHGSSALVAALTLTMATTAWTRDNDAMTFTFQDGPTASASWSGDTLTFTMLGFVFAFER